MRVPPPSLATGEGTMRSMVEGANTSAPPVIRPLHRLRRSPSPALRVRNSRTRRCPSLRVAVSPDLADVNALTHQFLAVVEDGAEAEAAVAAVVLEIEDDGVSGLQGIGAQKAVPPILGADIRPVEGGDGMLRIVHDADA